MNCRNNLIVVNKNDFLIFKGLIKMKNVETYNQKKKEIAIVLVSGGMDSATCLGLAVDAGSFMNQQHYISIMVKEHKIKNLNVLQS